MIESKTAVPIILLALMQKTLKILFKNQVERNSKFIKLQVSYEYFWSFSVCIYFNDLVV